MVLLRGNVVLAHEYFSSKQHRLIKFCVLICSQDTGSCKVTSTQNKLECMILHVRTVRDSLSGRHKYTSKLLNLSSVNCNFMS